MQYDRNPAPHRLLKRGMRGADIKAAQKATNTTLKQAGSKHRLKVDGIWGSTSERLFGYACHHRGAAHRKPTAGNQRIVRWPWTRTREQKRRAEDRRPKRPVAGQLTPNFHISEFDCHNGQKVPDYMEDDLRRWCQVFGEPLRARYGPAVINSGFRPDAYNRSIGGEPNSYHRYELRKSQPAGDVRFGRGNPTAWGATAKSLRSSRAGGAGGVGIYPRSGFIHCDTRTYASDWWG